MVFQQDVQYCSDVLCGADPDVGFLLFLIRKKGSIIVKLGVRSLGVELWKVFRSVAPYLVRRVEDGVVYLLPFEVIVQLGR